jgi:hypothetical protein
MKRLSLHTMAAVIALVAVGCMPSAPAMRPAAKPAATPVPKSTCAGELCFPYAEEAPETAAAEPR